MVKMAARGGIGVGSSRSENSLIRNEVVNMYTSFVTEVEPRDVLDLLIQKRVISIERKDDVMSKTTRQDRCRALLDQLFSCSHDGAFVVLRQALEKNYHWIVKRIDESISAEGNRGNFLDIFRRPKKPKRTEAESRHLLKENEIELTRQLEETNTKIKKLEDRFATKDDQLKQELEVAQKDLELTKNKECELARQLDETNKKNKELGDRFATNEDQMKQDLEVAQKDLELKKNKERELTRKLDEANKKIKELGDRFATNEDQMKRDLEVAQKDLELKKNKERELTRKLDEANKKTKELGDRLATKEDQMKQDLEVAQKDLELKKNKERELTRQLDEANKKIKELVDRLATKEDQMKQDLEVAQKDLELKKNKERELTRQLDEANWKIMKLEDRLATKRGQMKQDHEVSNKVLVLKKDMELELIWQLDEANRRIKGFKKEVVEHREMTLQLESQLYYQQGLHDEAMKREQKLIQHLVCLETRLELTERNGEDSWDVRASPSPLRRSGSVKELRTLAEETDWGRKSIAWR